MKLAVTAAARSTTTAVKAREGVLAGATMALLGRHVAMAVARFVGLEMVEGGRPMFRHRSVIAVMRVIAVVNVADKAARAMKPGTGADEDSAYEPVGTIVAIRSAIVRRIVKIAVRANRCGANIDGDLSRRYRRSTHTRSDESRETKNLQTRHILPPGS